MPGPSSIHSPQPAQRSGSATGWCRRCHTPSASDQTLCDSAAPDRPRARHIGTRLCTHDLQAVTSSPTGPAATSVLATSSAKSRLSPPSNSAMAARSSKMTCRSAGRLSIGSAAPRGPYCGSSGSDTPGMAFRNVSQASTGGEKWRSSAILPPKPPVASEVATVKHADFCGSSTKATKAT